MLSAQFNQGQEVHHGCFGVSFGGRRRESKRHVFVVGSLDKQIQDGKELIRLASAKGGGYFVFVWGVLT